jgi:hypothetical protein
MTKPYEKITIRGAGVEWREQRGDIFVQTIPLMPHLNKEAKDMLAMLLP